MNTGKLLLLMCIFVFFDSTLPDPTQCSMPVATEPYEKTLFVMLFEWHIDQEDYRNNILHTLKLLSCFIQQSDDFRGLLVDYSSFWSAQVIAMHPHYFRISELQHELDNVVNEKTNFTRCKNFNEALKNLFVTYPKIRSLNQHVELIVVNFMKPPGDCDYNDLYRDRLQMSAPFFNKVYPVIIDASLDLNDRFCLNTPDGCFFVDSNKPPSPKIMEYLGNIAASFHRPKNRKTSSTTVTTSQPSTDTTTESLTTSEPNSTTVLTTEETTTSETRTSTISTTTEAPYPSVSHDKPARKSEHSDDMELKFWLSILLLALLAIAIALTVFIIFKVWRLKKLLAKISKSQPLRKPLIPHEQSKKSTSKEKAKTQSQISKSNRESLSKSLLNKMSPT